MHEDMVVTLGKNARSYSMVKKWDAEFKRGRDSLEDEPRWRRPVTVTTQETIAMADSNGVWHCHWVGYLQGPHPCSHPDRTSYVKVSARSQSSLHVIWNRLNMSNENLVIFRQIPTVFFRDWDYGWDLGPSLPTTDKAPNTTVETPRLSVP